MRILCIEGVNLASHAAFKVDFEAEPLRSAGLFLINGPTGAGKSTVLDALCLALFDRTPRLDNSRGVEIEDVGDNRLKDVDPRSILRRGSGRGHAQVTFEGVDGQRYTARWEVWRARDKADGALQDQKMTLMRHSDNRGLGGRKTEVLEEVQKALGLTFVQFTRSVLLAQGDFAAFLKCASSDRAILLERMTGTEVYGEISKQAFLEASHHRVLLQRLKERRQLLPVLPQDARQQKETELTAARADAAGARADQERAQASVTWHAQHQALQDAVAAARQDVAAAEETVARSRPEAAELQRVDQAQEHRPAVDAVDQHDHAWNVAEAQRQTSEQEHATALAASTRLQAGLDQAAAAMKTAETSWEEAQPGLREARQVDADLEAADQHWQRLAKDLAARQKELQTLTAETDAAVALEQAAQRELAAQRTWLEEHRAWAARAAGWEAWRPRLDDLVRVAPLLEKAGKSLAAAETAVATAQGALAQDVAKETAAREALEPWEGRVAHAQQALEAGSVADLPGRRAQVDARLDGVRALTNLAAEAVRQHREACLHKDAARAAQQAAAEAQAATAQAEQEATRLGQLAEEADLALKTLNASLQLKDHRAELRDGEPCPLCGAVEHPYSKQAMPGASAVKAQEKRVKELRAQEQQARNAGAACKATQDAQAVLQGKEGAAAATAEAGLRAATESWRRLRGERAVDVPEDPTSAAVTERLEALLAAGEQERKEIAGQESAHRQLQANLTAARKERDAAQLALQQAVARRTTAEKNHADACAQLAQSQQARDGLREQRQHALEALSELGQAWQGVLAHVEQDARAVRERGEQDVAAWRKHQQDEQKLQARVEQASHQRELVVQKRDGAVLATAEVEQQCTAARQVRDGLKERREGMLGGRAVVQVEDALHRAQARAREDWSAAKQAQEQGSTALAKAQERWKAAQERVGELGLALADARNRLRATLETLGIPETELRRLLSRESAWRTETRARLQKQQGDLDTKLALRDGKQKELAQHQSVPPAHASAPEAGTLLHAARERLGEAERRAGALAGELARDDESRKEAAGYEAIIAQRTGEADLWARISDVIGSRDGAAFRRIAQNLTLEVLVAHANRHLDDLARRYQLKTVPNAVLELQVLDRDMGDEVRSIQTLSGGETFLVSLALALGLASVSSRATLVRSLFIDEGFGSLDSDTLEQAVSVLDGLQSMGCKVGVVSHVPGLGERMPVQVRVRKQGAGRSELKVVASGTAGA